MSKKSGLADSPFFQSSTFNSARNEDTRTDEHTNARTHERPNGRTGELPKSHSGKRTIKRQSYNVYVDQHEALKRLEATNRLSGRPYPISEMLREAIDEFLKKHQ